MQVGALQKGELDWWKHKMADGDVMNMDIEHSTLNNLKA